VQEDAPFRPRKGESLFQLLLIGDQLDPPQRIGMRNGLAMAGAGAGVTSLPVAANSSRASAASAGRCPASAMKPSSLAQTATVYALLSPC
jgi:hypothetical protein